MNKLRQFLEWLRGTKGYVVKQKFKGKTVVSEYETYKEAIEVYRCIINNASSDKIALLRIDRNGAKVHQLCIKW